MRLGICAYNMPASELLEVGACADQLGYDTIWLGEHVLLPVGYTTPHPTTGTASKRSHAGPVVTEDTELVDPTVTLAAIAARTNRIGLGTAMFILPLRHPLLVARAMLTLQEISGGRVRLGVGAGWLAQEFEAVGVDFESRRGRFREMVEILRLATAGGAFDWKGEHFEIARIQMTPTAVDLPLVYAGNTDGALRRAVRHGDSWFASGIPSLDEAVRLKAQIEAISEDEGRPAPLRTIFRVDGADPDVINRYQEEGLDDLVVWADRMWKVGDTVELNGSRLAALADATGLPGAEV